eukprot:1145509-Pelagomonas_calceolata.AAC.2
MRRRSKRKARGWLCPEEKDRDYEKEQRRCRPVCRVHAHCAFPSNMHPLAPVLKCDGLIRLLTGGNLALINALAGVDRAADCFGLRSKLSKGRVR